MRFWGLLVPIHLSAFAALYFGTFALLERAYTQAAATAARAAATEARMAEETTIGVWDVLKYADDEVARIALQVGKDAGYLRELEVAVTTSVTAAQAAVAKAASVYRTGLAVDVGAPVLSLLAPNWWEDLSEEFVWEWGSLHR